VKEIEAIFKIELLPNNVNLYSFFLIFNIIEFKKKFENYFTTHRKRFISFLFHVLTDQILVFKFMDFAAFLKNYFFTCFKKNIIKKKIKHLLAKRQKSYI
jgi:hypothetical protein